FMPEQIYAKILLAIFNYSIHVQTQGIRHTLPVGRICPVAIEGMTFLNEFFSTTHFSCGVTEQHLLLFRSHQTEQIARLGIIILIHPMIIMSTQSAVTQWYRWFHVFLGFFPLTVAVWLIMDG